MSSLLDHLAALELVPGELPDSASAQRSAVTAAHHARALAAHPDKGGDAVTFQAVHEARTALLEAIDAGRDLREATGVGAVSLTFSHEDFAVSRNQKSVATYRVEVAPDGNALCAKGKVKIPRGAIRVGSLLPTTGAYGTWKLLDNWRVSARVQAILPVHVDEEKEPLEEEIDATVDALLNNVDTKALCGFDALSADDQRAFAEHCVQRANFANVTKLSAVELKEEDAQDAAEQSRLGSLVPSNAPVFEVPRPDDATFKAGALQGLTAVITGAFDMVDDAGMGLTQGKEVFSGILESFGARVTSSVSKKTHFVLVGKEPGAKKLTDARRQDVKLVTPKVLLAILKRGYLHPKAGEAADAEPVVEALSGGTRSAPRKLDGMTDAQLLEVGLVKRARLE